MWFSMLSNCFHFRSLFNLMCTKLGISTVNFRNSTVDRQNLQFSWYNILEDKNNATHLQCPINFFNCIMCLFGRRLRPFFFITVLFLFLFSLLVTFIPFKSSFWFILFGYASFFLFFRFWQLNIWQINYHGGFGFFSVHRHFIYKFYVNLSYLRSHWLSKNMWPT